MFAGESAGDRRVSATEIIWGLEMNRSFLIVIVAVCGLVACGSSEEETATEPTTATEGTVGTAPTGTATATPTPTTGTTTGTTAPATGAAGATATGATITLNTGFSPDPSIATGTSGGAVEASTLSADCAGWVSATPDHILQLEAAMPRLKIMALGTEENSDVTLVVHRPDGSYVCNDDSDGFHPMIESEEGGMPAGRYEIFVGSYEQGRRQPYRLGITTQENATPSQALGQAAAQ